MSTILFICSECMEEGGGIHLSLAFFFEAHFPFVRLKLTNQYFKTSAFDLIESITLRTRSDLPLSKFLPILTKNSTYHRWKHLSITSVEELRITTLPIISAAKNLQTLRLCFTLGTEFASADSLQAMLNHLSSLTSLSLVGFAFIDPAGAILRSISQTVGANLLHLSLSESIFDHCPRTRISLYDLRKNGTASFVPPAELRPMVAKCARLMSLCLPEWFGS